MSQYFNPQHPYQQQTFQQQAFQQHAFQQTGQNQFIGQGQQQYMNQNLQQGRMTEPPQVITGKDLNYLKDALSWELDVIKKFNHFAQECQDQKTKSLISRSAQMHLKHYHILLQHLNPANSAQKMQY